MKTNDIKSNQQILKKLRSKAELCRYSHSELKAHHLKYRNWKEFLILLFSVLLIALINFYYRKILEGDFILFLLCLLPLLITVLQGLDQTIFQWTCKIAKHESAVAIWGSWLREADFLEKRIQQYESNTLDEKMQHLQEKYNICMCNTEQIPNNKFLKYKKKFKLYVLKSKEIDKVFLHDIEGIKKNEPK